jgi:hypothetical protein
MNPLHVSASVLTCYEGEQQGGQPNGALPNGDQQPPADSGRTFTQAEMNEVLAKDRRKHQGQLQKMEATLSTLAESKSLSEEDRARTEAQLEEVRTALLTKDQQVQREKKALEDAHAKKLSAKEQEAKHWESLYRDSTIERSLADAAVKHEAFSPQQIVKHLRDITRLEEKLDASGKPTGKHKPVVDFPEPSESGETVVTPLSPDAAVKRMKTMPEVYGNFFKGNVVSGVGSGSGAGTPAGNGKIDPRKLSMEQYLSIREKNPELLGLRRPKNNGRRL